MERGWDGRGETVRGASSAGASSTGLRKVRQARGLVASGGFGLSLAQEALQTSERSSRAGATSSDNLGTARI